MKILVIHTIYKLKGGEDSVVANEIKLLRSYGEDVELLQFSNGGNTLLKVLQLPFNCSSYSKVTEKLICFKPDVVHIHNLHFAASASVVYALKRHKVPFVITLHNYRLLCPSATLFYKGKFFTDFVNKAFSWKAVMKGVYLNSSLLTFWVSFSMMLHQFFGTWKNTAKFIALGQHTIEIFKNSKYKYLVNKIVVKPNFCYNQELVNEEKSDYYLYLGRLSEEKGLYVLLNAFANSNFNLKIAGTGPMEEEVISFAKNHPNIQFLGHVDKQTADKLLSAATALIFPSLWYETFGMVIIEAFAAGTPVIASLLGQLKFIINNKLNGLHFEAGNETNLREKIDYYQNLSKDEKIVYQRNALKSYQDSYSPAMNYNQLKFIYNEAKIKFEKIA